MYAAPGIVDESHWPGPEAHEKESMTWEDIGYIVHMMSGQLEQTAVSVKSALSGGYHQHSPGAAWPSEYNILQVTPDGHMWHSHMSIYQEDDPVVKPKPPKTGPVQDPFRKRGRHHVGKKKRR